MNRANHASRVIHVKRAKLSAVMLLALRVASAAGASVILPARLAGQSDQVKPILEIGALDAARESFGFIGDVAVTGSGEVLILDRFAAEIAWFASDGRFIRSIGRRGNGPGEFQSPHRMAIDERARLHVYDQRRRRIVVYALRDGQAFHVADQRVDGVMTDICTMGNRRFVLGVERVPIIHELDADGKVIRSFGELERPPADIARKAGPSGARMLRGHYNLAIMACDAVSRTIVVLHDKIPVVRAFNVSGSVAWRTTLEDYHERVFIRSRDLHGRYAFLTDPDIGSAHAGSEIAFTQGGRVAVSLWEGSAKDLEGRLEARILDVRSGIEVERHVPSGRLLHVGNGRAWALVQYPIPKVLIYDRLPAWAR